MEALGELFVPGGLRGWYCCAGSDCVLYPRLETIQLGDNSAECAVYIVLLVSERGEFATLVPRQQRNSWKERGKRGVGLDGMNVERFLTNKKHLRTKQPVNLCLWNHDQTHCDYHKTQPFKVLLIQSVVKEKCCCGNVY